MKKRFYLLIVMIGLCVVIALAYAGGWLNSRRVSAALELYRSAPKEHKVARFGFSLPDMFVEGVVRVTVDERTSLSAEIPWRDPSRSEIAFSDMWSIAMDAARARQALYPTPGLPLERNISQTLGVPAQMVCYSLGAASVECRTLIRTPQQMMEISQAHDPKNVAAMAAETEQVSKDIWARYVYGREGGGPGAFYTRAGRLESNGKAPEEAFAPFVWMSPGTKSARDGVIIHIRARSMSQIGELGARPGMPLAARTDGLDVTVLRDTTRTTKHGMTGPETVYASARPDGSLAMVSASWRYVGVPGKLDQPSVMVTMQAPPFLQKEALAVWDSLLDSLEPLP